jgi:hypothetical protein
MTFIQQAHNFPPQAASCATQPCTTARHGQILTRPPGGNDSSFWNKSNCSKIIATHLGYVIKLAGVGEVPCADGRCGVINFDGGDGGRPGTLKRQREATDAVKQGHHSQVGLHWFPASNESAMRRSEAHTNAGCTFGLRYTRDCPSMWEPTTTKS